MAGNCTCNGCSHDDLCPVVVPVTIQEENITIDIEGAGAFTIEVNDLDPVDATQKTVDIAFEVEGLYDLRMWFVDNPNTPDIKSIIPPTLPGAVQFEKVTDSDGTVQITCQYAGPYRVWYLVIACGAFVQVSPAIGIGA